MMIVTGVHPFDVHAADNKQRGPEPMAAHLREFAGLSTAVSGKLWTRRVVTAVPFLFGLVWSGMLIAWFIWGREKRHVVAEQPGGQAEELPLTPTRVGWSLDLPDKQ